MYTCELCGEEVKKGYLVVDLKLRKPYVICYECGRPKNLTKKNKAL